MQDWCPAVSSPRDGSSWRWGSSTDCPPHRPISVGRNTGNERPSRIFSCRRGWGRAIRSSFSPPRDSNETWHASGLRNCGNPRWRMDARPSPTRGRAAEMERETLDVDVLFVGAGPASLAGAYRLSQLIQDHNRAAQRTGENPLQVSVAVIEKGAEIGSH